MSRNFKSTKEMGAVWNPKVTADGQPKLVALETDFIDGTYEDRKDGVGKFNSTVYHIRTEAGEILSVWGDTVLNSEMAKIAAGKFIRIQYKGKQLKKDVKAGTAFTQTNSFSSWDVFVDEGSGDIAATSQPMTMAQASATTRDLPF